MLRTITDLTNAQIKALPTTPVQIVPAPPSGFFVKMMDATLQLNATAGAYTGIDATYSILVFGIGGSAAASSWAGWGPINDNTLTTPLTDFSAYFGNALNLMYYSTVQNQASVQNNATVTAGVAAGGSRGWIVGNNVGTAKTDVDAKAIYITMDSNSGTNMTGGNAANKLRVIFYYELAPLF